jgi:hypothetical protein
VFCTVAGAEHFIPRDVFRTVAPLLRSAQFLHEREETAAKPTDFEVIATQFSQNLDACGLEAGLHLEGRQEEPALTQTERGELEGLIANGLQHIKASETELCERYRQLKKAPAEDREGFLSSLWELNRRASKLERLIGCLDTN